MSPNVRVGPWFELPISFCAKNARTTTIRIGNAALLKNLLINKNFPTQGSRATARTTTLGAWPGLASVASANHPPHGLRAVARGLSLLERRHVGEVAVALGVVKAVADRELVGNLESDVASLEVDLAAV